MPQCSLRAAPSLTGGVAVTRRQEGMAVISALLIVAFVTVVAASLTQRQATLLRSVQAEQARGQAHWLLRGGLDWARGVLQADAQRGPVTHLGGDWAKPILRSRFGSESPRLIGTFSGRLHDEQAKFNLRNVVRQGKVSTEDVEMFGRLCVQLGIEPALASRIVQRVAMAHPRGQSQETERDDVEAEDDTAEGGEGREGRATLTLPEVAQAPMIRVLEDLLPLDGMSAGVLESLRPYVTVLPANTAININTAPARVLAAAIPDLTVSQAQTLTDERDAGQWFRNRGDLVNRLRRLDIKISRVRMSAFSQWFRLSSVATLDQATVPMQALIQRQRSPRAVPRVVWLREGA